jgi:hypothetical protein
MSDADRLLSAVLYDHLAQDEAESAEREILHDRDAGRALVALSSQSSLMVVAARSDRTGEGPLGETARALFGRTACPLAVLPRCDEDISASHGWCRADPHCAEAGSASVGGPGFGVSPLKRSSAP